MAVKSVDAEDGHSMTRDVHADPEDETAAMSSDAPRPLDAEPAGLTGFYRRHDTAIHKIASFIIVAVAWQVGAPHVSELIIVPLTDIWDAFLERSKDGSLIEDIAFSARGFLLGYLLAAAVGIGVAILMTSSKVVRDFIEPWVNGLYSTPTIALAPLCIIVFGIGVGSKVAVVFLLAVFPVLINTASGLQTTDNHLIEVARSMGATRFQLFRKVMLPFALPFIVAGLRLAVGRALVAVVVAEFFGSRAGVGFLIFTSSQRFDTASVFVGVFILAGFGMFSVWALQAVERKLAPWRQLNLK